MFRRERWDEGVVQTVFSAWYEARIGNSPRIEPEHLLLGLLRGDRPLVTRCLPASLVQSITQIRREASSMQKAEPDSPWLRLSDESEEVFAFAQDEASGVPMITTTHVLLGLLRLERGPVAEFLHQSGLSLAAVRGELNSPTSIDTVGRKATACRDCRHLIIDGEIQSVNLFCGASPKGPTFDCYTGELQPNEYSSPRFRFRHCDFVNSGDCHLFEPKIAP